MNWYIGQPIIAIVNSRCGRIKKGEEFVIMGLSDNTCRCPSIHIDIGLMAKFGNQECPICGSTWHSSILWKREELFAPLDVDISELTEIISNPVELTPTNNHASDNN